MIYHVNRTTKTIYEKNSHNHNTTLRSFVILICTKMWNKCLSISPERICLLGTSIIGTKMPTSFHRYIYIHLCDILLVLYMCVLVTAISSRNHIIYLTQSIYVFTFSLTLTISAADWRRTKPPAASSGVASRRARVSTAGSPAQHPAT
jgi:hypothetical protein